MIKWLGLALIPIIVVISCILFWSKIGQSKITNLEDIEILINKLNTIPHNLKTIITEGRIKNVILVDSDKNINITKFKNLQHIYSHEISRDGRYLLVWHEDYPPRKLSIYDINSTKLIFRFTPGIGGEITWTNHNNLIHSWHAGTNVICFCAYNIDGKELYNGTDSGFDVDPTGRIYITFPTAGEMASPLKVYDIETGKELYVSDPFLYFQINNIAWKEDNLIISFCDLKGIARELHLKLKAFNE